MKKILLLQLLLGLMLNCFSQTYQIIDNDADDRDTTELESLPWFGNNQYLNNLLDSMGYPSSADRIVGSDRVKYRVPIKFWVYRRSDGTGGPNLQNLQTYIDNLNRIYNTDNNTWIGFYLLCDIGFINDNKWFDIQGDGEAWNLIQNNKSSGCINIHIVGSYEQAAGIHIRARFFGRDGIVLNFGATVANANTTIAHEVGHYFELDHTHQYSNRGKCRKEAIDRNRTWPFIMFCPFGGGGPISQKICEATGDLLEDTPADPDLSNNRFNNLSACTFNALGDYNNSRDPWNDTYVAPPAGSQQPNSRNVMSYNRDRDCRIVFSRLQIAVMLYSIERGKSKNNKSSWKDEGAEYDEYEMDNFREVAITRNISINEIQERNFHQQYEEVGAVWTQCDVDWVRFVAPCNSNFDVFTFAMPNRTNADTRLTLFDNNSVQLAQNDDISPTNQFSRIQFNFIAGSEYFIRIENMSNLTTGYYALQIGQFSIIGNATLCTSGSYSVQNMPTCATVTWSSIPAGIVSFNPTGPTPNSSTKLTKINNGTALLIATVAYSNSPINYTYEKYIGVGVPIIKGWFNSPTNSNEPLAASSSFEFIWNDACYTKMISTNMDITANTTVTWQDAGNSGGVTWYQNGNNLNFYFSNLYQWAYFRVIATNSCGSQSWLYRFRSVYENCEGGGPSLRVTLSPNPVTSIINITLIDRRDMKKQKEIVEIRMLDKMGNIKQKWSYSKGGGTQTRQVNVNSLPADIYNIMVFDGMNWATEKFIKQ